jgi:hypothetical protein
MIEAEVVQPLEQCEEMVGVQNLCPKSHFDIKITSIYIPNVSLSSSE